MGTTYVAVLAVKESEEKGAPVLWWKIAAVYLGKSHEVAELGCWKPRPSDQVLSTSSDPGFDFCRWSSPRALATGLLDVKAPPSANVELLRALMVPAKNWPHVTYRVFLGACH